MAVKFDISGVRLVDAGNYFNQRRFPTSVLSCKAMNFSGFYIQRNALQSLDPCKGLDDIHRSKQVFRHGFFPSFE